MADDDPGEPDTDVWGTVFIGSGVIRLDASVSRDVKRILTGIKPTGSPHIGNYLGAIRPALALASLPETTAMYFIADYHALTTIQDGKQMDQLTREVAATWIAFGLDPAKTLFYRQSDVPETFELSWILACFTSKGWMNKMHAYKAHLCVFRGDKDAGINIACTRTPC